MSLFHVSDFPIGFVPLLGITKIPEKEAQQQKKAGASPKQSLRRMDSSVLLIKALGGSWNVAYLPKL